ncbi:hypothetical protein ACFTSF_17770 [Kribbella sp. NPDC056951]|uniref:Secreted protein n=1 Tax=Kribbella yunnanensis TaxID=190194 RepID=A0ABP4TD41_9ACTN
MRKLIAALCLGAAAVAVAPAAPALAQVQGAPQHRGHFVLESECIREGNRILQTSPRAETYECRPFALGGFDLYVTYR